jgi:hypothetical protein
MQVPGDMPHDKRVRRGYKLQCAQVQQKLEFIIAAHVKRKAYVCTPYHHRCLHHLTIVIVIVITGLWWWRACTCGWISSSNSCVNTLTSPLSSCTFPMKTNIVNGLL